MRKCILFLLLIVAVTLFNGRQAHAAGECGLSCCIAGAASSGVTLAENFGLSLAYEYMHMETIRNGTRNVSPDDAIAENQQMGSSYSVPTEMRMQKLSLIGVLPVTERLQLMASVPYIINDMDMRRRSAMGMTMDMTMDTVSGIGDVSLMGLYTLYTDAPIRPGHRLVAGLGIKTPTGTTSERTASGNLVHAMMQPGSGSWDPLFLLSYTRGLYPLVLQANLFHQLTTEGNNGYEFGDKTTLDLIARYQASDYINVGLELNGIHAERDRDHEGRYSRPVTSMADNPEFTGLDSVFITPAVQAKIPKTGGSAEIKYQVPVYQNVNGFQQVIEWWFFPTLFGFFCAVDANGFDKQFAMG